MRVTFIASPLTARSGVYRSARELVEAGRDLALDWELILGVSARAAGSPPPNDPTWVSELNAEPRGLRGVRSLARSLEQNVRVQQSDVLVSLVPQTDMALARQAKPWVAYVRGLPWPARGEANPAKALIWRHLETRALRTSRAVWATTEILQAQLKPVDTTIVPAGIRPLTRSWDGRGSRNSVVWAARFDPDKRPALFADALRGSELRGVMYGAGRLRDETTSSAPDNVRVAGWVEPDKLWESALAYVGTSSREAFGRSAVEAAMNGIPVILSENFGCANALVTDLVFRKAFILDDDDPAVWRCALDKLASDADLRERYSAHLARNASKITIKSSAIAVANQLAGIRV